MQAAARYISHTHERLPEHLALVGDVPGPRFRGLKGFALRCDQQRNVGCAASPGVICQAVVDTGVRLERRIPAEEDRVAHTQTGYVAARTGAKHCLLVQLVGNAETWLDFAPLNV